MMKSGFTLIELLIVIGIMGILMAIFTPNLLNAKLAAQDAAARAVARNMVSTAESRRSVEGTNTLYENQTDCIPTLVSELSSVNSCFFKQNASSTRVLVESKSGKYVLFDGSIVQPLTDTPPTSW